MIMISKRRFKKETEVADKKASASLTSFFFEREQLRIF
jgi:hypothetical protein